MRLAVLNIGSMDRGSDMYKMARIKVSCEIRNSINICA